MKEMLKLFFKFILAAAILYWLISQGKLDFSLIKYSFQEPVYFALGFCMVSAQLLLGAYRFGLLIRIKSEHIKGGKLIGIQWISQFFATVLPGAFTSDLIKIGYVKRLDERLSKSYIVFAMLLDRVIGLNSLLFLAGVTSLIFYKQLIGLSPAMSKLILINITLFVISIFSMSLLFIKKSHQDFLLRFIPGGRVKDLAIEVWKLQERQAFFRSYVMSILGHMLSITAFWIINIPFFQSPLSLEYFFTLIPLGHLAVVIPISPGGIGIGHAAFATLFGFIGHSNGASLYNVYWVLCLLISLLGIIPFFLYKSKEKGSRCHQT